MQDNEAGIGGLGLSMDTLTRKPAELRTAALREPIPASGIAAGRWRCSRCGGSRQPRRSPRFAPMWFRRACIFAGTAMLTAAGCYEMYEVLQVGGITVLEWMMLVLFVLLFAWIAFSFMSALAGFARAAVRGRRTNSASIPPRPCRAIRSRNRAAVADLQRRSASRHGAPAGDLRIGRGDRTRRSISTGSF